MIFRTCFLIETLNNPASKHSQAPSLSTIIVTLWAMAFCVVSLLVQWRWIFSLVFNLVYFKLMLICLSSRLCVNVGIEALSSLLTRKSISNTFMWAKEDGSDEPSRFVNKTMACVDAWPLLCCSVREPSSVQENSSTPFESNYHEQGPNGSRWWSTWCHTFSHRDYTKIKWAHGSVRDHCLLRRFDRWFKYPSRVSWSKTMLFTFIKKTLLLRRLGDFITSCVP